LNLLPHLVCSSNLLLKVSDLLLHRRHLSQLLLELHLLLQLRLLLFLDLRFRSPPLS
jgi:hypothetical protein